MTLTLGDVRAVTCPLDGLTRCGHRATAERPVVFSRGVASVRYTNRPNPTPDQPGRGRHRRLGRLFR